ncbi:MAG: flippase-like domain-containing protein [Deltaproteobacteria bacterium]|nr:flippase-like domain-containing protein [Deltaproteobacteria bacterium]
MSTPHDALTRFRPWAALFVALAVLGYVAIAVWTGLDQTATALATFRWWIFAPVLALTLVNYGLRYLKWHYLLGRLGVRLPHRRDLWVFGTGLAMVISPGRAGELVKPYLVRSLTGAPIARTLPALVSERVTDGLAVVLLAGLGVGTWHPEGAWILLALLGMVGLGLVALFLDPVVAAALALLRGLPLLGRAAPKVEEVVSALRTCLSPAPLLLTLSLSLVAWGAECVGYWLVFQGLQAPATLEAATFLYASATVFGGPSPGGMGIADGALVEGAIRLVAGMEPGSAVAAALLIRVATLWFGVALGAVALVRVERLLATAAAPRAPGAPSE